MTQAELVEKLNITDRAISKWETGKGMPDTSIMLELCNEFCISVNELLSGEMIKIDMYNQKAEETLLEMAKKEELQNKKMMMYEWVIGILSSISFIIILFVASYFVTNNIVKIILFILSFVILFVGVAFALMIEIEAGYYECKHCRHRYVPKYNQVYFSMYYGTTRFSRTSIYNYFQTKE